MKTKLALLLCLGLLIACNKLKRIEKIAPSFIGNWEYREQKSTVHTIYIQENGRGYIHGTSASGKEQDTQKRGWYLNDSTLYFSKYQNKVADEQFQIVQFPSITDSNVIWNGDTIKSGSTYVVLGERVYLKTN